MKIMNANQAFNEAMNRYPTLYHARTLEDAKFKYFDHIFNVIGNGYRDLKEFIEAHRITKNNKHMLDSFPDKYIGNEVLYYAYTQTKKHGSLTMGDDRFLLDEAFTKEELATRPDIVHSFSMSNRLDSDVVIPYPNLTKEYSMVWTMDMNQLDKSWQEEALNYYYRVQEFFNSDQVHKYDHALPVTESALNIMVADYDKHFLKYRQEGMSENEWFDKITNEYEMEYRGNTKDFIKHRWIQKHNQIKDFINESIEKLKNDLILRENHLSKP